MLTRTLTIDRRYEADAVVVWTGSMWRESPPPPRQKPLPDAITAQMDSGRKTLDRRVLRALDVPKGVKELRADTRLSDYQVRTTLDRLKKAEQVERVPVFRAARGEWTIWRRTK